MPKVVLICGFICSGKSVYAKKLLAESPAVLLNIDEIMLSLFDEYMGDAHDEMVNKVKEYLYKKAVQIIEADISVILDWGFWSKAERASAIAFFHGKNIKIDLKYVNVSDENLYRQVEKRNNDIKNGHKYAYSVDMNLIDKCKTFFEKPSEDEGDIWHKIN